MAEESDRGRRERDMVLAPNEYMFVSDTTKGNIDVFRGPTKQSLSGTDQPVLFDEQSKRFNSVDLSRAVQVAKTAPEGWYVVLKNPARDGKFPAAQGKMSSSDLDIGRKINIPGPVSFALWPGQMAKVLKGHHIRSNQYLLVRVYDEEAAAKNWKNAIIKTQTSKAEDLDLRPDTDAVAKDPKLTSGEPPDLTMGKLLVIKGTEVSFYIPPTGVEVVPDENGTLVREAVTLGRLEYCLLYDENGNKRYEQGPQVVFPEPTEVFAMREIEGKDSKKTKTRKFKAIELNENSGIYVKVIAEYDEAGKSYKVGDELFITGKQQMIYFPREEHAIVKYDNSDVYYGIAIPAGEARYVLDRNKGDIRLVKGPTVFLPDPRREVITKRILDLKLCDMLFPGNRAVLEHNAKLADIDINSFLSEVVGGAPAAMAVAASGSPIMRGMVEAQMYTASLVSDDASERGLGNKPARGFSGDQFDRKTQYTAPRTITLNTKFDGAVTVDVWTGYAMMLVRKSGEKRVVVGPQTVLFEYDESPQVLTLSRGKPKTTDNLLRTAFLLTRANKVSDIIQVETSDFCKLQIKLSYRVNFEDSSEKWFGVENYVKFLCDHMRSKLRNAVKKHGVEDFYAKSDDIIRDVVLGKPVDAVTGKLNNRLGMKFEENGMHIYDVEVLDVALENKDIASLLTQAQREVINHALKIAQEKRNLLFVQESESIKQKSAEAQAETVRLKNELSQRELTSRLALDLAAIDAKSKTAEEQTALDLELEKANGEIQAQKLAVERAEEEQEIAMEQKRLDQRTAWLEAESKATSDKAKAITPELIAALTAFGDKAMIEKVAESMGPLAILGGKSVTEVLSGLLQGTNLAKHLLPNGNGTGNGTSQPRA